MSGKEQFVKLPREVLESAAFGSLGINGFRVLRFLMIEHMRRGGRENGELKAPHRQLVEFGIAPRHVTAAIIEAEESGLVACHRHGQRVATTYELTWFPLHDGSPASDLWRSYADGKSDYRRVGSDNPETAYPREGSCADNLPTESEADSLPTESEAGLPTEGKADDQNLPTEGKADAREICLPKGRRSIERSYQGDCNGKEAEGEAGGLEGEGDLEAEPVGGGCALPTDPTRRCGWYVTGPLGFRICQNPVVLGGERCGEHARLPVVGEFASGKPNGSTAP